MKTGLMMAVAAAEMTLQAGQGDVTADDARKGPETPARVDVYVFDGSAQFLPADLSNAEALVAKIFGKVGIQVTWVEDASAAHLLLRIWESSTVRGTRVTSDALGFRLSPNEAVVLADATGRPPPSGK